MVPWSYGPGTRRRKRPERHTGRQRRSPFELHGPEGTRLFASLLVYPNHKPIFVVDGRGSAFENEGY